MVTLLSFGFLEAKRHIVMIDSLLWGRRDGHFAFLWLVACIQNRGLFALPLGVIGRLFCDSGSSWISSKLLLLIMFMNNYVTCDTAHAS